MDDSCKTTLQELADNPGSLNPSDVYCQGSIQNHNTNGLTTTENEYPITHINIKQNTATKQNENKWMTLSVEASTSTDGEQGIKITKIKNDQSKQPEYNILDNYIHEKWDTACRIYFKHPDRGVPTECPTGTSVTNKDKPYCQYRDSRPIHQFKSPACAIDGSDQSNPSCQQNINEQKR